MNDTGFCPTCSVPLVNDRCLNCGKEYGPPTTMDDELHNYKQSCCKGVETPDLDDRINQILQQDDTTFDSVLDQVHKTLNTLFLCLHAIIPRKTQLSTLVSPDENTIRYSLYFTSQGGSVYELLSIGWAAMTDDNEFPIMIVKDDDEAIRSMVEFDEFLVSQVKGIRRNIKIINKLTTTT